MVLRGVQAGCAGRGCRRPAVTHRAARIISASTTTHPMQYKQNKQVPAGPYLYSSGVLASCRKVCFSLWTRCRALGALACLKACAGGGRYADAHWPTAGCPHTAGA